MQPTADRNLLFGVLALQMDFIGRDALVAGMNAWVLDKAKPLGRILVDQGALKETAYGLLDPLVQAHLDAHGGDAQRSLAAISSLGSAVETLRAVGDADVLASLAHVSAAQPATIDDPNPTRTRSVGVPTSTGLRFRVLRLHDKGALGEVFVALDEELPREVALKQIQERHADDPGSRARFVLEAEVTGGLEHPGIVPVYGLGKYADGRPFYAMRFIKGDNLKEAIKRFHESAPSGGEKAAETSSERNLQFRQLLRRFIDVCNAIAYAHSRGVLHRDLKPGNVMLGKYGETLVVDWGLAKVGLRGDFEPGDATKEPTLRPQSASGHAQTQMGATVGTPAFMSPEQALGQLDQLGPASDIYSLGATLYVLLTGRVPIRGENVGAVLERVRRGDFLPPAQAKAGVPLALDAICRKAMALKPADRYATAQDLAADIEHWLADEPVTAYQEPWAARLARWGRRHRPLVAGTVTAAAVAVVSLGVGLFVVAGKAEAERMAKEEAQKRLVQIEKGTDILGSIFVDLDPYLEKKQGKPLREILGLRVERAAEQLDGQSIADPLTVAQLQRILGSSLVGLSHYGTAVALLEKSSATLAANLGDGHPDTLRSCHDLARAYQAAGRLDLAIPLLERTLEAREAKMGNDHTDTLQSRTTLANFYQEAGRLDLAIPLLEQSLNDFEATLGDTDRYTVICRASLAHAYQAAGKLDLAIPLHMHALKALEAGVGENHPDTLACRDNLASAYLAAGKLDLAIPLFERTLKAKEADLGSDHRLTLTSRHNLAVVYLDAGKLDQAIPLFERTLKSQEAKLGDNHPDTLACRSNLAGAYRAAGKLDQAIPLFERTLKSSEAKLGRTHPDTLKFRNNLALVYQDAGKLDLAIKLYDSTLKAQRTKLGDDHPDTLISCNNLASAYRDAGKLDQAMSLLERTVKTQEVKLGDDHPDTLTSRNGLALIYRDAGKLDLAIPLLNRNLKFAEAKLGDDHPNTLTSRDNLAVAYQDAGKLDLAMPLFEVVVPQSQKKLGLVHPLTMRFAQDWIAALEADRQYAKAIKACNELLLVERKQLSSDTRLQARTLAQLGSTLLAAKQPADAEPVLRECLEIRTKKEPDAWTTFVTQSMLGAAVLGQNKYADAEPLLLAGYEGMKQREAKILPKDKVRLRQALGRLVQLYGAWSKEDKAEEWRKKLETAKPDAKTQVKP
jgi:tetratricopeptide (TPR) repeat protein/tRNA A-37 threonylcarbamoyl transferase component Bud32